MCNYLLPHHECLEKEWEMVKQHAQERNSRTYKTKQKSPYPVPLSPQSHNNSKHHRTMKQSTSTVVLLQSVLFACVAALLSRPVEAFSNNALVAKRRQQAESCYSIQKPTSGSSSVFTIMRSAAEDMAVGETKEEEVVDYEVPEDAVINIKPKAMKRLRELREKQKDPESYMVLRMGVRNGGCSGLSYVMDFSTEEDIQEDDEVDHYPNELLKCVVDAKSMLYLYGLELDYSEELIGGGFKFFNPNAEESCGCGSSFGV